MRNVRIGRGRRFWTAVVLAAAVASGCSSTADSSTSRGEIDEAGLKKAQDVVTQLSARPTEIGVTEPIKGDLPRDVDFYFVMIGSPELPYIESKVKAAIKPLGWKLTTIDAGVTPESMQGAMDRVLRNRPEAALIVSLDADFVGDQIKEATAAGTKVVLGGMTVDAKDFGGVATLFGTSYHGLLGEQSAAFVTADSRGDGKVVLFDPVDVPVISEGSSAGFAKGLKEYCSGCDLDVVDASVGDIGQSLPGTVVAYLRRNPDVEYVVLGWGGMATGIPGALADAGIDSAKVKVVAPIANPELRVQLAGGSNFIAGLVQSPDDQRAYTWVDGVARSLAGDEPLANPDGVVTNWLLTPDSISQWPGDPGKDFPVVDGFDQQFWKLWGVS